MRLFLCRIFMSKLYTKVHKVFILLCLLSIFIKALPFVWWYAIISFTLYCITSTFLVYSTLVNEEVYEWVCKHTTPNMKEQLDKLRKEYNE